jgi:O-acetyl-ADP-ribose deacetylase (regulator of RNase III)
MLLFVDNDPSVIKAYKDILSDLDIDIKFSVSDIRKIDAEIFVSPANSYGEMTGGIDKIYTKMFPGIQKKVMDSIKIYGFNSKLSVGSSILVPITEYRSLICAPTMESPSDIRDKPENVYKAMIAILAISPANSIVAIPGLGTGCGNLTGAESAMQIKRAIEDWYNKDYNLYGGSIVRYTDTEFIVLYPSYL